MGCPGPITTRRATPEDAPGIARVHVETWRHAYRDLLPADFLRALDVGRREAWWREQASVSAVEQRPWVADATDGVVAFASAGPARDDDLDPTTGELYAIYVHPRCARQGIGRQLLAAATDDLRASRYADAVLWVLEANDPARAFYESEGWRLDGARKAETLGGVEVVEVRYRRALAGARSGSS